MSDRERFEKWAIKKWADNNSVHAALIIERGTNGEYISLITRGAWEGWRAAVASERAND